MKLKLRATWHTLALLTMLAAMWYAAEAQSNGAAYLLAMLAGLLTAVSVLHARANLRGLSVRVRSMAVMREGERGRVRVEVTNQAAKPARGVEWIVEGAARGVFVDGVEPGETRHLELPAPAQPRAGAPLRLVARSVYPLGLYSMEAVIEAAGARVVHPKPAGNLPLPSARPLSPEARLLLSSGAGDAVARGGDDFAGTREWQPGDSPRHIDWRAVARGRPLVVKTWAAQAQDGVVLDWEAVPLAEEARGGQMARWIEDCAREGRPFELRLPTVHIPVGGGEAQARRCLDALGQFLAARDAEAAGAGQGAQFAGEPSARRVPWSFETSSHLPPGPLRLMGVALLLSFLPLAGVVALPCMGVAALCFLWRAVLRLPVPHVGVRLLVLGAGVFTTWFSHATLRSMEAGIGLLITLAGAKLLESRTPREFQILAMIGWFLCLCGIVLDNSLTRMLWCVAAFAMITLCLVRFRHSVPGLWRPARVTGAMFAQAVPLVAVLFLVFPRGLLNLSATFGSQAGMSGITDELDPGSLTSVALRMERAFKVEFPDGRVPTNDQRYWRCLTLWDCHGLRWRRGQRLGYTPRLLVPDASLDTRHIITLEPSGARWLPALDIPLRLDMDRSYLLPEFDDCFASPFSIRSPIRYEVRSRALQRQPEDLPDHHREAALALPQRLPASMRALAAAWENGARSDEDIVLRALEHYRTQGYEYTLTPDDYSGPDGFEDFMLRGKKGFCEHFSASFATLMRLAGVPSRVVVGFLGGEWVPERQHMIVRQSDAHAWVEVWLERLGWLRIDPTAALAPDRVNQDPRRIIEAQASRAAREFGFLGEMVFQVRVMWDRLSYAWEDRVVDFDREEQSDWLASLGWRSGTWWHLLGVSAGVVALGLLAVWAWLRRRAVPDDPWARAWQRLCRKLLRAGFPARRPCEGPLAYVERLRTGSAEIEALVQDYVAGRYGAPSATVSGFARRVRRLRVGRRAGRAGRPGRFAAPLRGGLKEGAEGSR
ncbi:MAG: DUF3488 domain-containing protein [Verrucomicrobiaceae bacterium]|nr:DUF3488 domain-containing protein [Verrucomicrobiaceae bacterium]